MKPIIIYKSFLGSSRAYANWLNEEIDGDIYKFGRVSNKELGNYDPVIIISGTYAGWMPLVGFLKRKWAVIKGKHVVVIAVGIAPADVEWSQRSFEKIPLEIREKIKYFKIPGRIGRQAPAGEVKKENLNEVVEYIRGIGQE